MIEHTPSGPTELVKLQTECACGWTAPALIVQAIAAPLVDLALIAAHNQGAHVGRQVVDVRYSNPKVEPADPDPSVRISQVPAGAHRRPRLTDGDPDPIT